jgi:hypothetical protein
VSGPEELFGTCSPHRVGQLVPAVRDYYHDEYAERVLALLPEWISWLTERNGTPAELADRCRPYAQGEPYPGPVQQDGHPEFMARVPE